MVFKFLCCDWPLFHGSLLGELPNVLLLTKRRIHENGYVLRF